MLTVVFDGECAVCTGLVDGLCARLGPAGLRAVPNQAPGVPARYGLTPRAAAHAVWVIDERGRAWAAAAGINVLLAALGFRRLAGLYRFRAIARLEELGYALFSRWRHRLQWAGPRPACERRGHSACAGHGQW